MPSKKKRGKNGGERTSGGTGSSNGAGSDPCEYLLVAAIDFGTTFSGWAYQFKHDHDVTPTKVYAKNWNNGTNISCKTPTTVLIRPDGQTLEAFGYKAEDRFAALVADGKEDQWFYIRHFKMKLYETLRLKRDLMLRAENGRQLPAMRVFSLAIRYLKEDMFSECNGRLSMDVNTRDVLWVLTVPAIWDDAAKQFMREAAVKAGIDNNRLMIALEPETASVYCKALALDIQDTPDRVTMDTFAAGAKYIVLDAGGGTIDITAHEILADNKVRELHKPTGGGWGGTTVDRQFEQLICDIFGQSVMDKFARECMDDFLSLFRTFEIKKREVTETNDRPTTMFIPGTLTEVLLRESNKDLKTAIFEADLASKVTVGRGNKVFIDASLMKSFYKDSIRNIIEHLKEMLQDGLLKDCKIIVMVGGYSEADMLRDGIRKSFSGMRVINPTESGMVVLKGAVMYGWQPTSVSQRVCKYTYGISVSEPFIDGVHPPEKEMIVHGKSFCTDVFMKLVEAGQIVSPTEKIFPNCNRPFHAGDKKYSKVGLYASEIEAHPAFTTDPGCLKVGQLVVENNKKMSVADNAFEVGGVFGGTEIILEVKHVNSGKITKAAFDSLG